MWYARVTWADHRKGYGNWIPTGCSDLDDAKYYIKTYWGKDPWQRVVEWLKM